MDSLKHTQRFFWCGLLCICVFYAVFEYFFIPYGALCADEFVFARHIYDYTRYVPYRDFLPYKTILGYYLLSIPFFFTHTLLAPLFYIKDEIALANVLCLLLSGWWATIFFKKRAILLTVLALLANQLFFIYSTDLRVDMLTSWMCLFAAFSILQKKSWLGGFLLGIAFLISQKAIWTFCALNGAILLCWQLIPSSCYRLRFFFQFNLACILPIIVYIYIFSLLAPPTIILHSLFYEAYIQANIHWYLPIYFDCWKTMLRHGPMLFFLWPLTLFVLLKIDNKTERIEQHLFVSVFSAILLILFINYKQPFPYNFVFTLPAFFLLYANFFSWLIDRNKQQQETSNFSWWLLLKRTPYIAFFIFVYMTAIFYFVLLEKYVVIFSFIALLPPLLYFLLFYPMKSATDDFLWRVFICIFLFSGVLYPLCQSILIGKKLDGHYQQTMIGLTNNLTGDDGGYLGGVPFLYNQDQLISSLTNIIGPVVDYLNAPNQKLASLLLPSLYLSPTTIAKVLADFNRLPVKVVVANYRTNILPLPIQIYLFSHYQHYYGSVYLYAPIVFPGQHSINLKFSALYRLTVLPNAKDRFSIPNYMVLDNKKIAVNQLIKLARGVHHVLVMQCMRLVLVPPSSAEKLNPKYQQDNWPYMLRAIVT